MLQVNDLLKQKSERAQAAHKLMNAAVANGKDLQGAELTEYDGHISAISDIQSLLDRHARLASIPTASAEPTPVVHAGLNNGEVDPRSTPEFAKSFWAYMRKGDRSGITAAMSVAADGVIIPTEFDKVLVEKLIATNVMRQLATVITTNNDRKIAVENNVAAAGWAAEGAVSYNDGGSDEPSFSQVTLSAYKATRIEKVSEELLQDAFFDIAGYLARKFGVSFGLLEEAAYFVGSGSGQPTGVTAAATAGITAAGATTVTGDEVIALFHSLKRQYRTNASWVFTDSMALIVRKIKETTGQYIWQPGLTVNQPDSLLGKPVYISDFVPLPTTGLRSMLFGDFSYYTIADRSPRTFTRLNELYAATGQIGFRATQRTDGKLTLAEAVVALTQA